MKPVSSGVLVMVVAAIGAAGWSTGVRAQDAAARPPVFNVDPFWPKPLPNNWLLGNVVGVAVDAKDHIWIIQRPDTLTEFERGAALAPGKSECCRPAPPVIEFDQAGKVVQAWGGPGQEYEWPLPDSTKPPNQWTSGNPVGEHTIFVDHNENVWVGSNGASGTHILKFTRSGKFLLQIGKRGEHHGSNDTKNLGGPAGIHVDPKTDEVFVADGYVNRRVIVFDANTGAYKRHWGAYGNKPDDSVPFKYNPAGPRSQQFNTVHCVHISRDDLVYVCDRANSRIQVFKKDGTFVKEGLVAAETMPPPGSTQDLGFSPDPEQRYIYVADGSSEKVWILRRSDLQILSSFGHGGHDAGGMTMAHSMAVDSKGNVYVGESLDGKRVQRFSPGRGSAPKR